MNFLKLWAPFAKEIELVTKNQKLKMQKDNDAYWTLKNYSLSHMEDYAFIVDNEGPYPDPRSFWQPEGVYGFSRWIDHSNFHWHDQQW